MSQTAVWAPAPLRKGLLPLLLASAVSLGLILSHFFQVGLVSGRDMLSNSVSSPCSSPLNFLS